MRHSESTFYHQTGWKHIVERSYGHKPYYIFAKDDEKINDNISVFYVINIFYGNKLFSIRFVSYEGVCTIDNTTKNTLLNEAKTFSTESSFDYLDYWNIKENDFDQYSHLLAPSILINGGKGINK
jgi:serine/alanine adding enzyme